jgi:hypothetical protein
MIEHFYKQVPGFFSFQLVYDLGLSKIPNDGKWVEVGAWQGQSLSYAVVESLKKEKNVEFYCVDIWTLLDRHITDEITNDQDLYNTFIKNIEPIKDYINIIKESSATASRHFQDNSLDFVMIDADHSYEAVKKDMEVWWPKVKPGGMMVGDDMRKHYPGVKQACWEFVNKHNITWDKEILKMMLLSGCWILYKPTE